MKPYGLLPKEIDNPHVKKGDYGRYGHSKNHRESYLKSERAIKKRERNNVNKMMREFIF